MNNFAVVIFLGNEDTVAVVPQKWIIRQTDATECYWPNGPDTERKVRCQQEPQPTWDVFPVRVLVENCETYNRARVKCKRAESTSDLNSADEMGRGFRVKKRKYMDDEVISTSSGESEDEKSAPQVLPPPPKNSPVSIPARVLHQNQSRISYGGSCGSVVRHQSLGETLGKEKSLMVKGKRPQSPVASCSLEWQLKIERKVNQILQNQQEILIRLEEIAGKSRDKMEENLFEHLPLQCLPLVLDFQKELENTNVRNQFIDFLKRVGGSSVPDATRRCLRAIFTDDVARHYSLDGLKGNDKFGDTNIYSSLSCAVLNKFPAATRKEVDAATRDWLRHCNDRRKNKKL